jgi:transcriptional regulator with GAF, ATPase, and Fis domain
MSTSSAAVRRTETFQDFDAIPPTCETTRNPAARVATAAARQPAPFIGRDPKVLELLDMVDRVADTTATVLITGESGTGKELIARLICGGSSRRKRELVAVNCGAIPESLQESEFFGHVKGAFTGASRRKVGKLEMAHGGTIFLDEIGEMSRSLQVALLRTLQSGEYSPVGSAETRFCDVRVIAAANRDLLELVGSGEFREDLYYRLNIIHLEVPPLRERRGDLPLLCDYFTRVLAERHGKRTPQLTPDAQKILFRYHYPGNVRELENVIRRAVILGGGADIAPELLPPVVLGARVGSNASLSAAVDAAMDAEVEDFQSAKARAVESFERSYLTNILRLAGGVVSRASGRSGLSERNFHEKLKRYGINARAFRRKD